MKSVKRPKTSQVACKTRQVSEFDMGSSQQLVSVAKARRILGSLANTLDDNQVKELLHTLHLMARQQLCYDGSKK